MGGRSWIELVLIVLSVLLALWLDEVREDWGREERARAWQAAFAQELCGNAQLVRQSLDERRTNLTRLEQEPDFEFVQPFPSIRNVSWEVLRNSDIMPALSPEWIDLAARVYASQSQYRETQPQFYLSANLRRIAQSVSGEPISRAVLGDAYRGFIQLETELLALYEEVEQTGDLRCDARD